MSECQYCSHQCGCGCESYDYQGFVADNSSYKSEGINNELVEFIKNNLDPHKKYYVSFEEIG